MHERLHHRHQVEWVDGGREAKSPANPQWPDGVAVDLTNGAKIACEINLLYPAPRVGRWDITCLDCRYRAVVTTAGRRDDPRTVRLPCKLLDALTA